MNQSSFMRSPNKNEVKNSRSVIESAASTSLSTIEQEKKSAMNSLIATLLEMLISVQDRKLRKGWKSYSIDMVLNFYLFYCSIFIPTIGNYDWGEYGSWIFEVLNYPTTFAIFRLPYIAPVVLLFCSLVLNLSFYVFYFFVARAALVNSSPKSDKIKMVLSIWGQIVFYSSLVASFVVSNFADCSANQIIDKAQIFNVLTNYPAEKCYGTLNIIFLSIGIFNMVIMMGVNSINGLTLNECNPKSSILFSAESTIYKLPLVVSNMVQLVVPFFVPDNLMMVRGVIHLVIAVLYIPFVFYEVPYFKRVLNSVLSGIAFARVGSSIGAIVSTSVNTNSSWDLGLGMSGLCLVLIMAGFLIGFTIMEVYTRFVCYSVRNVFFSKINSEENMGDEADIMEKEANSLFHYFESNNELRRLNMFMRFALRAKKSEGYDDITLSISFAKGIASNKMFVDCPLLVSCSLVYSYFCQGQPNNNVYARVILTRGLKQRPSTITKLRLKQRIKDLDGLESEDSEIRVRAEQKSSIEQLQKHQKQLYALHRQFWKEMTAQNIDIDKIENLNRLIASLTESCNEIFVNILNTRSGKNDKNLLRLYGKFLEELCFNIDQAEELYEEASLIEEEESKRRSRNVRKLDHNNSKASKNRIMPLPNSPSGQSIRNSTSILKDELSTLQRDLGAEETLEDLENMLGVAVDEVKKKNSMINIALTTPTSNLGLKVFYGLLLLIGVGLLGSSIALESILVTDTINYVPLVNTVCTPSMASVNGLNKLRMRQAYFTRNDPSAASDITRTTNYWLESKKSLVALRDSVLEEKLSSDVYYEFSKPAYSLLFPHLTPNTTLFLEYATSNASILDITNNLIENFETQWGKTDATLLETTNSFSFMFLWRNDLVVSRSYSSFCQGLIEAVSASSLQSQQLFLQYFACAISVYFTLCITFFILSFVRLGLLERAIKMYAKVIPKDISGKVYHDLCKQVDDDNLGSLPSKFTNPKYVVSASAIILTIVCCIALVVAFMDLQAQTNIVLQNMYSVRDGATLMTNLQWIEFILRETFLYEEFTKFNVSITPPQLGSDWTEMNNIVGQLHGSFFLSFNRLLYGDEAAGIEPLVGVYPEVDEILKGTNCSASPLTINSTSCTDYVGLSYDVASHLLNLKRFVETSQVVDEPTGMATLMGLTKKTQIITYKIAAICETIIDNTTYDVILIVLYTVFAFLVTLILGYVIHNIVAKYESSQRQLRMMLNYLPEDQIESIPELKSFVLNHQLPNLFNRISQKKSQDDSTSKLTGILDSAVDGVCLSKLSKDQDYSLEYFNPSCERMFGVTMNEVAGASLFKLFDEKEAQKVSKAIEFLSSASSSSQKGETIEVECLRKNGSTFSSKLNIFITMFNGKSVVSIFIKDITPEKKQNALLAEEKKKSEALLRNIMPDAVAARLKTGETFIAEKFNDVSVFFSDMVGFTRISSNMQANELVLMLNAIVNEFDALTDKYHLEKVKTIGDAYFCVGGIHGNSQSDHPERMLRFSIDTLTVIREYNKSLFVNCLNVNESDHIPQINIRIGINTGSVIGGVIGTKKFAYDFWGDTINTASRMESNSKPGRIQLSRPSYERVHDLGFEFEERHIDIKGKDVCATYLLKDHHHERGILSKEDLMEIIRQNHLKKNEMEAADEQASTGEDDEN